MQSFPAVSGANASIMLGITAGTTNPSTVSAGAMWINATNGLNFCKVALQLFDDVVLKNKEYVDLITGDVYSHKTYYMGLVDKKNKVNFYDGDVRVVDPDGKEVVKFKPSQYLEYVAEHTEPWSYLKFPFLKKIGWKGFVEGKDSGVYRVSPLARLNVADGMATPLAQVEYDKCIKRSVASLFTLHLYSTGPGLSSCYTPPSTCWNSARIRKCRRLYRLVNGSRVARFSNSDWMRLCSSISSLSFAFCRRWISASRCTVSIWCDILSVAICLAELSPAMLSFNA
jgi:hypothetical protein